MKVLIFGSKGMLGQALHAEFMAAGEVVAKDKDEIDIVDEGQVRSVVLNCQPDLVINAAAYTNVDGAEENQAAAFGVNEKGVANIARAVRDLGAIMIHFSTDYVFDGKKREGYEEDDPPGPAVNSYGASKLAGERVLKEINPKFYLIRTAWLYGRGGKNFVDTMVGMGQQQIKADHQSTELRVVNDQWGSPTYTVDLAEATRKIAAGRRPLGIYHLVNEGVTTWYELAVRIFDILKQDVTVTPVSSTEYPRPAKRPTRSVLINKKGLKLQSWQNALANYLGGGMINNG